MDIIELARRLLDRRPGPEEPLRIVQAGHPALRRPALEVGDRLPSDLLVELAEAMTLTMRRAPGVGLAAPQIGLPLRLIVVEDAYAVAPGEDAEDDLLERRPLPLRVLADPRLDLPVGEDAETVFAWEGCLSVAGWRSIVPRSRSTRLRATELDAAGEGHPVDEELSGWTARILQHETDHLDGVLCHDRMVPRSYVDDAYVHHYAELPEAVRRLGLQGDVARLGPGEVVLRAGREDAARPDAADARDGHGTAGTAGSPGSVGR